LHLYPVKIVILLAFTLSLIPIVLSANYADIPTIAITGNIESILQVICIIFLSFVLKKASEKSLTLFWRYFLLALIFAFVSNMSSSIFTQYSDSLMNSFATLFIYFFIILAVETSPHLNDIPLGKYINGRIPAIFFTLACFSYFILLPAELVQNENQKLQANLLFHAIIISLVISRLFISLVNSKGIFWCKTYLALLIAATILLADKLMLINNNQSAFLSLVSYPFLLLAASCSIKASSKPHFAAKAQLPELYVLVLMVTLVTVHFYGNETHAFYLTDSNLQTLIVSLWLVIGSGLIAMIVYNRLNETRQLEQKLKTEQKQKHVQYKQNQSLKAFISNNEDKAIVHVSNNAILTTSTTGKILSANPAAVQMFQCLEQELVNLNVSQLFAPQDEMHYFFDFKSNVFSLQRKEQGISVECTSLRTDGTEFPAQAELQWANREDAPLVVITFINLSARKLAEAQTLELKDKFIANISHEFRTPLTIINGVIDKYIRETDDKNEVEDLTTAKRNGLRLVRMVEQLLELSRLSDNPQLVLNTFRLKTLLMMPIDSFSQLASQSQLTFKSDIPDDLWLECDPQAFEKIIFNLLANAIKYTPNGGNIEIVAYQEQDSVILDIIDSGIGISKSNQEKIFERFQRADDNNNQAIFGVGIGLSLVNELVKAHGWRINVISEQNHGSKFSLTMPLATAKETEKELPYSLSENEVASLLTESKKTVVTPRQESQQVVLVIEDNLDMQSHIKQVIEQQHHCILASSGEQGLQLAQEYMPDLIVCDLMLTGIDGFEVLTQLKDSELTAHIPVILLTARSDLESRLKGLNLHADEYLSKPFNHHELLTRIKNLIDNRIQLQQRYWDQFESSQKEKRLSDSHENLVKLTEPESSSISLDEQFLNKLEALIAKHYTEPDLDISTLASALAMSDRQLQRKLKVMLNITPNNFIKEFRLKKAKELLKNGGQIGRVALDVGFSSQTYFGRCFKEVYQCTPKQFQQAEKSD